MSTYIDRSYQMGQVMGFLAAEQAMEGAVAPGGMQNGGVGFDAIDDFARAQGFGGQQGCSASPQQMQDMQLLVEMMMTSMLMRQMLGNAGANPMIGNFMRQLMAQSMGCGCRSPNGGFESPGNWGSGNAVPPWSDYGRSQAAPWDGAGAGPMGSRIAQCAAHVGSSMCSVGRCYAGVKEAIREATGIHLEGGSAYQAAGQLAASGRFHEVSVSPGQLRNLPAGAVVVWGQTDRSPHGHISVALGNGMEASDHVSHQLTALRGYQNYRVFIPNGGPQTFNV